MLSRRKVLASGAAMLAAPALSRGARAAEFPDRSVRVFITTAAGGTSDIMARLTSRHVSDQLGKPFIIENRAGAGGNIATLAVHREPADGYTLLAVSRGNLLANVIYDRLEFDFARDFSGVASIATGGLHMLVNPLVPAKTLPEFIGWAKANPDKVNYGTPGNGTDPHFAAELLKIAAGVSITHVPYRGGALALTDLISGNIQLMFSNLPVAEFIAKGQLRSLGVTSKTRAPDYPDVPAIAESYPGFEVGVWHGFVARRNCPPEAISTLNRAYTAALSDPKVVAGLAPLGLTPEPMTTQDMDKFFAEDIEKWGKVARAANIKAN